MVRGFSSHENHHPRPPTDPSTNIHLTSETGRRGVRILANGLNIYVGPERDEDEPSGRETREAFDAFLATLPADERIATLKAVRGHARVIEPEAVADKCPDYPSTRGLGDGV